MMEGHDRTSGCSTGFTDSSQDALICFWSPVSRCTARTLLRLDAASGHACRERRIIQH